MRSPVWSWTIVCRPARRSTRMHETSRRVKILKRPRLRRSSRRRRLERGQMKGKMSVYVPSGFRKQSVRPFRTSPRMATRNPTLLRTTSAREAAWSAITCSSRIRANSAGTSSCNRTLPSGALSSVVMTPSWVCVFACTLHSDEGRV